MSILTFKALKNPRQNKCLIKFLWQKTVIIIMQERHLKTISNYPLPKQSLARELFLIEHQKFGIYLRNFYWLRAYQSSTPQYLIFLETDNARSKICHITIFVFFLFLYSKTGQWSPVEIILVTCYQRYSELATLNIYYY